MFKMSFAVYRRPDFTREQFLAYWRDVHAPLAMECARAMAIQRYVQLHSEDSEATELMTRSRGCAPPHDGVCQIWWNSEEERLAAAASPEGQAAGRRLREDEMKFCDLTRSTVLFGHEHVIIDETAPA